jgi:hypothetical protein
MKKTNGFVKTSYIVRRSKNQLGNTLVPIVIALAISAVASVGFLNQGANLSASTKILKAQYEIADALDQWSTIKAMESTRLKLDNINDEILITNTNAFNGVIKFFNKINSGKELQYHTNKDRDACKALASRFSSKNENIHTDPSFGQISNPVCVQENSNYIVAIRLVYD